MARLLVTVGLLIALTTAIAVMNPEDVSSEVHELGHPSALSNEELLAENRKLVKENKELSRTLRRKISEPGTMSEELGEGVRNEGRRGGGGMTGQSFGNPTGGGISLNRAANTENMEDIDMEDLGEEKGTTAVSKAKAATKAATKAVKASVKAKKGGKGKKGPRRLNAAKCDTDPFPGSLPCSLYEKKGVMVRAMGSKFCDPHVPLAKGTLMKEVNKSKRSGKKKKKTKKWFNQKLSDCPDDLTKGKYFIAKGVKKGTQDASEGMCLSFDDNEQIDQYIRVNHHFGGEEYKDYDVITKAAVIHPDGARENIGMIALKRVVCNKPGLLDKRTMQFHVKTPCKNGKTKKKYKDSNGNPLRAKSVRCSTYKMGHCIHCPYTGASVMMNGKSTSATWKHTDWKKVFKHAFMSSAYGKNCAVGGTAKRKRGKWVDNIRSKDKKCEYFATKRKVAKLFADCVKAAVKNGFITHDKDGVLLPGGPQVKKPFACSPEDNERAQYALNAL